MFVMVGALAALSAVHPAGEAIPAASIAAEAVDVKSLIAVGRRNEAKALLVDRVRHSSSDVEAQFLLGMLAIEDGDNREAIDRFRAAMIHAPDAPRIRLELARALYQAKQYDNALHQFRLASSARLPGDVTNNINRYMDAIRRERRWSYRVGFALAPDTNINQGTSSRETILFGLPFELGADTRRKSGVGVVGTAELEFAPRLSEAVRLRMLGAIRRRDYRGKRFDDMTVAAEAGPTVSLGRWDVGAAATLLSRWYGGRRYQQAFGAKIDAVAYRGNRTAMSVGIGAQRFRYPDVPFQSGPVFSGTVGLTRMLGPSSVAALNIGISRQRAKAADLSNWAGVAEVAYTRDLRGGFSIAVEPSLAIVNYDAADPFFLTRRKDSAQEISVTLVNRRLMWWRFNPSFTYTFARRRSTIDLYDSDQSRFEFGLASAF